MGGPSTFAVLAVCTLLSYASACIQGEKSAVDGDCGAYMECNDKGELVQKKCAFTKKFDAERKECDFYWRVTCYKKPVECKAGKVYPHPDSCSLYYSCVGGHLAVQSCSFIKVFDPATGNCKFGWGCDKVACVASESRVIPGDCSSYELCEKGAWVKHACDPDSHYDPATKSCLKGGCTQCKEGDVRAAKECNHYEECSVGLWFEKKCFIGKRFDPAKKICVWFFQYSCTKSNRMDPGWGLESCAEGEKRPIDCKRYKECIGGRFVEKACSDCMNFNKIDGICSFVWDYPCQGGEPTTQPAPVPSTQPAPVPSTQPAPVPSTQPAPVPSTQPTPVPTTQPAPVPTTQPTPVPTTQPAPVPTAQPGPVPSTKPGPVPTTQPTPVPSTQPAPVPSTQPAPVPTTQPGPVPTTKPGPVPTTQPTPVPTTQPGTPCEEGMKVPNPTNCRKYFVCKNRKLVPDFCWWPRKFDSVTTECVFWGATCAKIKPPPAPVPTTQPGTPCEEGVKVPNPTNCRKYFVCKNRKLVPDVCWWPRKFDSVTTECVFWGATCAKIKPPPGPVPTTQPGTPCEEGVKVPNPTNCRKYFVCTNRKLVPDVCWWPRKFDSVTTGCVFWGATCGIN